MLKMFVNIRTNFNWSVGTYYICALVGFVVSFAVGNIFTDVATAAFIALLLAEVFGFFIMLVFSHSASIEHQNPMPRDEGNGLH